MLIGAHVSPAGGPANAVARGVERSCRSIQFFNQSPRAWKPRVYSDEEVAAFHEAVDASEIDSVLIHAVYLLNCASEDKVIRDKSLEALTAALRAGDALGAAGVVLHPGSALKGGGPVEAAITRAAETIAEALAESENCPLHLEDTAGAGGTLGRSFAELASLIEQAGGGRRLAVCLDSCHLLASGYDVSTADGLGSVIDDFDSIVGLDRLAALHFNDSATPLGSNVDRHAPPGEGHLAREGCAAFLSEPRFEGMPVILEGPGIAGKGIVLEDIELAVEMREEGIAARRGDG
jgi:deoxyribonuclease IV